MDVFLSKVSNVDKSVREILELLDWRDIIDEGDQVLIKPNFTTFPEKGITTDLELIRAIYNVVKERTDNVFVGETESLEKGFEELLKKYDLGYDLINLSNAETHTFKGLSGTFKLPKIAMESKIINIPVFKTHFLTNVTFGIKNLFGLIQNRNRTKYHRNINSILMEISSVFNPEINIMDGIYSMDGNGPMIGNVHKTDFIIASKNVVAMDMAACELIGLDYTSVEHIRRTAEKFETSYDIVTDNIETFKMKFEIPRKTSLERLQYLMDDHWITRAILYNSLIYSIAKRTKRLIKKK